MIDQIDVVIHFDSDFDEKTKIILERAAHQCPVHRSISSKVKKNIVFNITISHHWSTPLCCPALIFLFTVL